QFAFGLYFANVPPVESCCDEISDKGLADNPLLNNGLPSPAITGAITIRYSSKRLSLINVSERFALPNTYMSRLPCAFNLRISADASVLTKVELFQSAEFNVREKTSLGTRFIRSAIPAGSPFAVFQYAAMPSNVIRPYTIKSAA